MRIIRTLFIVILVMVSIPAWSATYYMANNPCSGNTGWGNGSDSNAGTKDAPWLTLHYSMSQMSAGDTLTIDDGTYIGHDNSVLVFYGGDENHRPPISDTLWTTIQAENVGQATFDGQGERWMFYLNPSSILNCHWIFDGVLWGNGYNDAALVTFSSLSYVKFLRCGAFEGPSGSNVSGMFAGASSSYILFEGCYTWGRMRTGISAWCSSDETQTHHIIFRNCVSRIDRTDAGNPSYNYGMYSVDYGLVQNCIAIDTDQTTYYANTASSWAGGLATASTDHDANNVTWRQCLVVNSAIGSFFDGTHTNAVVDANDTTYSNCVFMDIGSRDNLAQPTGLRTTIDHCNFINGSLTADTLYGINAWAIRTGTNSLTNSIITGILGESGNGVLYNITDDYCAFYNNHASIWLTGSAGAHTTTTTNPIYNASTNPTGALKYPVRIESGSNLSGQGSTGDIGANLVYLYGTPGTIWGETGYDTVTDTEMWPFPNEAIIKTKMAAYTYDDGGGGDPEITGARGFAAAGKQLNGSDDITLTSYIWEYLGNEIPSDIYGEEEPAAASNTTCTGCTGVGVTFN